MTRRGDRALYAIVGFAPHQIGAIAAVELVVVWLLSCGLSLTIGLVALWRTGPISRFALAIGVLGATRFVLVTLSAGLSMVWFSSHRTVGSVVAALKDR